MIIINSDTDDISDGRQAHLQMVLSQSRVETYLFWTLNLLIIFPIQSKNMKQTNETNKVTEQRAPDEMWKIFFQEHAEHRQEDHYEKGKLYQNSPIFCVGIFLTFFMKSIKCLMWIKKIKCLLACFQGIYYCLKFYIDEAFENK